MARGYTSFYNRPNLINKTIGIVYVDYNDKITEYKVLEENETHLLCYSEWTRLTFSVKRENAFKDREELKYHKYCERINSKKSDKIKKYVESTKQTVFRDRYINEFPEKLI